MSRRKKKRVNRKPNQQYDRNRKKIQRNVKDRLFRYLFEKDREALLNLYNALNGTAYRDSSQLEIVTIESAVSDLSGTGVPDGDREGGEKPLWNRADQPAYTAVYRLL